MSAGTDERISVSLEELISRLAIEAKLSIRMETNEALREAFKSLNCNDEQATSLIRSSAQRRRHEKHRLSKEQA